MASTTTLAPRRARLDGARRLLQTNPGLPPALLATVIFVALAGSEAGFYPIGSQQHPGLGWYPAASAARGPARRRGDRGASPRRCPAARWWRWPSWAATPSGASSRSPGPRQQGVAWDGANRTAIYLVVLRALRPLAHDPRRRHDPGGRARPRARRPRAGRAAEGQRRRRDPPTTSSDARFAEPAGLHQRQRRRCGRSGCSPASTWPRARQVNPVLQGPGLGGAGLLSCLGPAGPEPRLGASRSRSRRCSSWPSCPRRARALAARGGGRGRDSRREGTAPRRARRLPARGLRRAAGRRHPGHPAGGRGALVRGRTGGAWRTARCRSPRPARAS